MKMRSVFSSHVDQIGYDEQALELHVKYKTGKTAVYRGVPASTADNVMSSPSIGSALHRHVKGKYDHGYPEG